MLRVGIHDNVIVHKTVKNDRGTLVVGMKQLKDFNPMVDLNAATDTTNLEEDENDFMIFPFNASDLDGNALETKDIMLRISDVKDPLTHILQQYMTAADIKWDILAGTGVTNDNLDAKLKDNTVLAKIYGNISDQFIRMMSPFVGKSDKRMRVALPRQSANRHYPGLRKRYLSQNPFMEPMTIPADQSKVKFSKYEVDNKLDDPTPTPKSAAPKAPAANVSALFSGGSVG